MIIMKDSEFTSNENLNLDNVKIVDVRLIGKKINNNKEIKVIFLGYLALK